MACNLVLLSAQPTQQSAGHPDSQVYSFVDAVTCDQEGAEPLDT